MAMSLGLRDPWGVEAGPGPESALANCLANSEPMKAASNSQGPNRWRMEEQRGRAELGSGLWCSGSVPVTAFRTNAEVAATMFTLHTFE